jgi:hypothetical protein
MRQGNDALLERMMGRVELPPFDVLQRALTLTTERLARELAAPTGTPPDWSDFEWVVARAVATLHGISGLLANRLRWRGPADWRTFLDDQLEHSRARERSIRELLAHIDAATRERGVPAVALKGSALLGLDLYRLGERPMGDIDLLVSPAELRAADLALRATGFEQAFAVERHVVFWPAEPALQQGHDFGEHVANPMKIEVHTRIAEHLPVHTVDITERLTPSMPVPGINGYRDPAALMRHLLLHAAGNMRAHALRFLQLKDVALLAGRLDAAAWRSLVEPDTRGEPPWWMLPPLTATSNYFGGAIPRDVLDTLRCDCPRALVRTANRSSLSRVSWSNLRVHAFPGVSWSRSPLEALRFITSRIWPKRAAREMLRHAVESSPGLRRVAWYELPHALRMLHWVFGKPPRVQTLLALHGAFDASRPP